MILLLALDALALAADYRPDLSLYASYFCEDKQKSLHDKVLTDAQLELAYVQTRRDLNVVANEFATGNRHRGYTYGKCEDGKTFIVSTPAPAAIVKLQLTGIQINQEALNICRKYSIDVIQDESEQPRTLDTKQNFVPLGTLSALSITCFPSDKTTAGPELWALVNIHPVDVPAMHSITDFFNWLNVARRRNKLPDLLINDRLNHTARKVGTDSLMHPHSLLMSKKFELMKRNLELLGENRAISEDFTGLAQLLWNSPQHRALLLNAKANAIGYALEETKDQKRLVLLVGRT